MSIDVSSLRRFQEIWEPVIQSIPAVINMVEMEADLDRSLAIKRSQLEKAQKEIDAAYDQANVRLSDAKGELAAIASQKEDVQKAITAAQVSARQAIAVAEEEKKEALASFNASIAEVQTKLKSLQGEYDAKRAKAEAEHSELVQAMVAEIDDLNARKEAAKQALDAIKATLG